MSKYIANLISQGEHQTLDFKHSITDSKKIARSLCAFVNTLGGTLLIGVKDNGNIIGVNSEEEYYMVETAAQLFCKPEIHFKVTKWTINGKTVLEVEVKPSKKKPYKAPDKNGEYKAYIRIKDENIIASPIQLKIWKKERFRKPVRLNLTEKEQLLFKHLKNNKQITISQFSRIGFLSSKDAENTLVDLAVMGLIKFIQTVESEYFELSDKSIKDKT